MKTQDLEKLTWHTEHDTAKNQMIHTFENGVQIITDFRFKTIITCKDRKSIEKTSLSQYCEVEEYMNFLLNTAKQAKTI